MSNLHQPPHYDGNRYQANRLVEYHSIHVVPTEYDRRNCTDVCCLIIGVLFSLILLILAFIGINHEKYVQTNFPADSQGRLCGVDLPAYPFVYFAKPNTLARRVCVASCPTPADLKLDCTPTNNIGCRFTNTPGFEMAYYDNEPVKDRNGWFCYPTDPVLRQQLREVTGLKQRELFIHSLDSILVSAAISLGVSLIFLLLVQFLPKIMNKAVIILGVLAMIALVICIALYPTRYGASKWIVFTLFVILTVLTIGTIIRFWKNLTVHGIFLEQATLMVCDRIAVFAYIPLFTAIAVGFAFLLLFEFKEFWMYGFVEFDAQKSLYHELWGAFPIILTILWFIQLVWGFSFIKEAFNFCVSGNAIEWYYKDIHGQRKEQSCLSVLQLFICKHFGSVIAGGFMIGFFSLWDYLFDFFKPDNVLTGQGGYNKCFGNVCKPCLKVFELVRSDAMANIALAGNPFCNSSRYVEYLCEKSLLMDNSQSASRAYRVCANVLLAAITSIICLYLETGISVFVIMFVAALSVFVQTFFISLHADAAEAILIVFMEDEQFHKRQNERLDYKYNRDDIHRGLGVNIKKELADVLRKERIQASNLRNSRMNDGRVDQYPVGSNHSGQYPVGSNYAGQYPGGSNYAGQYPGGSHYAGQNMDRGSHVNQYPAGNAHMDQPGMMENAHMSQPGMVDVHGSRSPTYRNQNFIGNEIGTNAYPANQIPVTRSTYISQQVVGPSHAVNPVMGADYAGNPALRHDYVPNPTGSHLRNQPVNTSDGRNW